MNYPAFEGKFKYRGKRSLNKAILSFALCTTVITSFSFSEINWYSSKVNLQEPQLIKKPNQPPPPIKSFK